VNRMLTLLARTEIVRPVPAAGPPPSAISRRSAIRGLPRFSERGTRVGRYR